MEHHSIDLVPDPRGYGAPELVHRQSGISLGKGTIPLFDAARALLAHGLADPDDNLATYRRGMLCCTARVGWAAKRTVAETNGPRITRYVPFNAQPRLSTERARLPALSGMLEGRL